MTSLWYYARTFLYCWQRHVNTTAFYPVAKGDVLLSAQQLSCIRQERVLFEQLDVSVSAGQLVQIAGKNGAGKSSLLRILAALAEPDEGQLSFCGRPLSAVKADFAASLCFIGHHSGIHEQLTARENIRFWHAATEAVAAVDEYDLLGKLGLAGLEDVPCRMLSAGQQRRVSLARLWFSQRQLWILDEPFTALDQSAIAMLQQHFSQHLALGGAIVLTTHQPLTMTFAELQTVELMYRW